LIPIDQTQKAIDQTQKAIDQTQKAINQTQKAIDQELLRAIAFFWATWANSGPLGTGPSEWGPHLIGNL
jgi:hypothetical protein